MTRAELIASLPDLKREHLLAQRKVLDARSEADALQSIIEGIERLAAGDSATVNLKISVFDGDGGHLRDSGVEAEAERVVEENPAPRGADAVRKVMADGRPWKQQAIVAEILRRGWIKPDARNPESAIREAVRRLARHGEILKVGSATYRLIPPELPLDDQTSESTEPAASIGVQTR